MNSRIATRRFFLYISFSIESNLHLGAERDKAYLWPLLTCVHKATIVDSIEFTLTMLLVGIRHPRSCQQARPAHPPRNPRSTLARILATHPTPPRRKRHPPSVQPLRDYLFNRPESLQGLPALLCRFVDVDRGLARDRFQKPPSGQQIQIRQRRFEIQVCPVDDIGFG